MRPSPVPSDVDSAIFLSFTRPFFIFSKTLESIEIFQAETVLSDGYRYELAGGFARGLRDGGGDFVPTNISEDQTS
jgi:hypothetical protein